MEAFWVALLIILFAVGVVWMVRTVKQLVEGVSEVRKIKGELNGYSRSQKKFDKMIAAHQETMYVQMKELNTDYRLGLDETALRDVASAIGEADAIERIQKYIDPAPITAVQFMDDIGETLRELLEESPLSREKQLMVLTRILNGFSPAIDDEFVEEIAASYSQGIPDQLSFMRGKIHYTLAALGSLHHVAEETHDRRLKKYVQSVRKERGFGN